MAHCWSEVVYHTCGMFKLLNSQFAVVCFRRSKWSLIVCNHAENASGAPCQAPQLAWLAHTISTP